MQKAKKRFERVPVDEAIRLLEEEKKAAEKSKAPAEDEDFKPERNPGAPTNVQKHRAKHAISSGEEHPCGLLR